MEEIIMFEAADHISLLPQSTARLGIRRILPIISNDHQITELKTVLTHPLLLEPSVLQLALL